jgi:hypothetical protein
MSSARGGSGRCSSRATPGPSARRGSATCGRAVRPAACQLVEAALDLLVARGRRHLRPEREAAVLQDVEVLREFVAAVQQLLERRLLPRAARPAALASRCVWNCIWEATVTYVLLRVRAVVSSKIRNAVKARRKRRGAEDLQLHGERLVADQRQAEIRERPRSEPWASRRRACAAPRQRPWRSSARPSRGRGPPAAGGW